MDRSGLGVVVNSVGAAGTGVLESLTSLTVVRGGVGVVVQAGRTRIIPNDRNRPVNLRKNS